MCICATFPTFRAFKRKLQYKIVFKSTNDLNFVVTMILTPLLIPFSSRKMFSFSLAFSILVYIIDYKTLFLLSF